MDGIMKKVLITGAAGFIGKKLSRHFIEKGYDVIGWDCRISEEVNSVRYVDMVAESEVTSQLEQDKPDLIIHCAGSADVGKSVQNPSADFVGNVLLTHNLLFAMHKLKMKNVRFVFLSSAGVYGNPSSLPITEDAPLNPMSPYAVHKVMCEDLCRYFVRNYGMDIKVARIFSAYGAGLRKQIFWDMYNKAQRTGRLDMFGTGNESRDYIHIDDVIQSIYLIATEDTDEMIFNVANGEEITIRQATELFASCMGMKADDIGFNGTVREGDPLNWRADISKIQKLGYQKTVQMQQGISDYCSWATEQTEE